MPDSRDFFDTFKKLLSAYSRKRLFNIDRKQLRKYDRHRVLYKIGRRHHKEGGYYSCLVYKREMHRAEDMAGGKPREAAEYFKPSVFFVLRKTAKHREQQSLDALLRQLHELEGSILALQARADAISDTLQSKSQSDASATHASGVMGRLSEYMRIETGWEEARDFYFAAQSGDSPLRADLADPDFAGDYGWDGGLADDLVRLGRTLERSSDPDPVRDATTISHYTDRKALRREREKKIALGHKVDDHEEEQIWEKKM